MNRKVDELATKWLKRQTGGLGTREHHVLESTLQRKTISQDTSEAYSAGLSFGERLADRIACFGGSWTFIVLFLGFLALWAVLNAWLLGQWSFDPYPFIFLNLMLSMLAAMQAPVIMMAQNRQAQRDRIDAAHDYEVNLKAEIEIMALHEKLDEMWHTQILSMRDELAAFAARFNAVESALQELLARQSDNVTDP